MVQNLSEPLWSKVNYQNYTFNIKERITMKKVVNITVVLFIFILSSTVTAKVSIVPSQEICAVQDTLSGHKDHSNSVADTLSNSKIWNTVCPVMGEEVDSKVQTATYGEKVIGFCCKSCVRKFTSNPEKYMKKFNEDGTALKEGSM